MSKGSEQRQKQGSPDSVQEMLNASQSAERALLTEENLSDPHRKLRSPGPPPNRKTLPPGGVNGSPTNDESSAGTDIEGVSDGRGSPLLPISPLMEVPEQPETEGPRRWKMAPPTTAPPMSVFDVSTVAGSLHDMAYCVDTAAVNEGGADPKEVYRGLEANPDLLSLGGEVYQGTDLLYDPPTGLGTNPEAEVEAEETGSTTMAMTPGPCSWARPLPPLTRPSSRGTKKTRTTRPTLGAADHSGMVDVTDEELQRMEQQQWQQEEQETAETSSQQSRPPASPPPPADQGQCY